MEQSVPIPWPMYPPVSSVSTESAFLARPPLTSCAPCPLPSPAPCPPDPPELLPDNCLSQSRPQPLEISPGTEQCLHLHICGGYNPGSHVAEIVEVFSCIPHQIFTLQVQYTHCQFEQVMDMDTLHNTYKSSLSASPIAHC